MLTARYSLLKGSPFLSYCNLRNIYGETINIKLKLNLIGVIFLQWLNSILKLNIQLCYVYLDSEHNQSKTYAWQKFFSSFYK